jgi:hypothetical protein
MIKLMIGGAVKHRSTILTFILKNKKFFEDIEVTVYDGFENCSWNGGRINRNGIELTENEINLYYNNNVNIALTFSNPEIDLSDKIGNSLLNKFHREGNKIILTNFELIKYVREKFPKYQIIFSITGLGHLSIPLSDSDLNFYKKLEKICDYIVPRMEHTFDNRFLELTQSKYEIMVNDTCIYNCHLYKEHFESIAKQNLIKQPWETLGFDHCFSVEECWLKGFDPNVGDIKTKEKYGNNYGMDLSVDQVINLKNRGIESFKITGRENSSSDMLNELEKYIKALKC